MNYIIFGAGKTAYTIKRFIENCRLDDKVVGFFDFYDNNPFNLTIVDKHQILNHNGKFIVGTIMQDSIVNMKKMATEYFNIKDADILQINDVLLDGKIDQNAILNLSDSFDDSFETYQEVIAARASFNFNYFNQKEFAGNYSNEYLKYDLIKNGAVIIDGGSYDGTTAKGFSNLAGEKGMIYSFDCDLNNILEKNRSSNIKYFDFALYDAEKRLNFHKYQGIEAPGSFVTEINNFTDDLLCVRAISLDIFNERFMNSSKIDFIKLDIEGAEVNALQGAKGVILRDKPKLAIACYHVLDHYWEIPKLLLSFDPTYRIGFDHYSDYFDGSVLYFY
jgi:FkbM family methyltransferase